MPSRAPGGLFDIKTCFCKHRICQQSRKECLHFAQQFVSLAKTTTDRRHDSPIVLIVMDGVEENHHRGSNCETWTYKEKFGAQFAISTTGKYWQLWHLVIFHRLL